jgi:hypothetical protein
MTLTRPTALARIAREPLAHFVLLGALLFGADHLLAGRRGDPQAIVVGAEVDKEARDVFQASMKREPSAAEMQVLRQRWIDNEVLYREALALGLDRGDSSIRERLIFKALSVTQSGIDLPRIDEAGLRAWFEAHRAKYDEPVRVDFLEAVLIGDSAPEAVSTFLAALRSGRTEDSDARSALRVFKARPRASLVQSYGEEFTVALEKLPIGQWTALSGRDGLRVVRLEAVQPGQRALYADVKEAVYRDWKEDAMQRRTTEAVRSLAAKYRIAAAGATEAAGAVK